MPSPICGLNRFGRKVAVKVNVYGALKMAFQISIIGTWTAPRIDNYIVISLNV
jgi:hypothetical protein